jgi:hypothetical protein
LVHIRFLLATSPGVEQELEVVVVVDQVQLLAATT